MKGPWMLKECQTRFRRAAAIPNKPMPIKARVAGTGTLALRWVSDCRILGEMLSPNPPMLKITSEPDFPFNWARFVLEKAESWKKRTSP